MDVDVYLYLLVIFVCLPSLHVIAMVARCHVWWLFAAHSGDGQTSVPYGGIVIYSMIMVDGN